MKTIERKKAIQIISSFEVESLSIEERESKLLDWWSINEEDEEFHLLSDSLQQIILSNDMPVNPDGKCYDQLLVIAISYKYIGVKNSFIEKMLFNYLSEHVDILGFPDSLLPCPCCNYNTIQEIGIYGICPVCSWEDDGNRNPELYSSCNHLTLRKARSNFIKFGACDESAIEFVVPNPLEKYEGGPKGR
jgi:Cysteine-rich CPCC